MHPESVTHHVGRRRRDDLLYRSCHIIPFRDKGTKLSRLVPALFGVASPHLLVVPGVDKKFSETGELLDPAFEKNVSVFSREFLWLAEQLCPVYGAVSFDLQ